MIRMSPPRFRLLLLGLAIASLGALSCGGPCTDRGCAEGLTITLTGGFDPDKTYTIDMKHLTPGGDVGAVVMTCALTWSSVSGGSITCTSPLRFQADAHRIQIFDRDIRKLRVSVSLDGAVVGQKDYDVAFTTQEINGDGCGWCTSASINLDFPDRPFWGLQGRTIWESSCWTEDMGGFWFEATRDELSDEQLRLLSEVQVVPRPRESCPAEQAGCDLRVTYINGSGSDWHARPTDATCTFDPQRPEKLVSFASFEPFRRTLGCWQSKALATAATAAASGTGPMPVLSPNAICQHGIFATAATTTSIGLEVPEVPPGPAPRRHITLNLYNHAGPVRLELYDPTGTTLLAQSADTNEPGGRACQVIDFAFGAPGTYVLKLVVSPSSPSGNLFIGYE